MKISLIRPVKKSYVITFSYSEHIAHAIQHNLGNSYRGGIDYVGYNADSNNNIPLYCADKGIVNKIVYDEKGYGNCIKIKHDWGYSLYAHMKYPPTLTIGTTVDEFTVLGYQGHTGNCRDINGNNTEAASHVHFEIRDLNDNTFDPTPYIIDREDYILSQQNPIFNDNSIHVGSVVCIKDGAKSYTGQSLWNGVYGQPYTVDEIYGDRVLLDRAGICTPVNINDVYLYDAPDEQHGNNGNNDQIKNNNETNYYTVKAGDNLWSISQKFNTTIDNIMKLNPEITNANLIYVGQTLKIK